MLSLSGISKHYGGLRVVDDVALEVPERGLVGLVGTNGAGKSTLFAIACGQIEADAGSVSFGGVDVTRMPARRRARLGLGRTFQVPREFASLTVLENLLAAAPRRHGESLWSVYAQWPRTVREERRLRDEAQRWLRFLNLQGVADSPAGGLSGGQKKLLELGRVLMLSPKAILLDEPFAGVNPVLIAQIADRIRELNRERGMAFLVIEHHLEALGELADRLYVMDQGRVIAQGGPAAVLADPRVHEAYMGGVV